MELSRIFDACQASQGDDWCAIPGGDPGTDLLVGLVDAGSNDEPALTALTHDRRAVYLPDARLGLGWGMDTEHSQSWKGQRPEWADPDWSDVVPLTDGNVLLPRMPGRILAGRRLPPSRSRHASRLQSD